jgi:hypothetical protein
MPTPTQASQAQIAGINLGGNTNPIGIQTGSNQPSIPPIGGSTTQPYNQNATTTGGAILPNPMSPAGAPTPTPVVSSNTAANGPVANAQNVVNTYDTVTANQSQNLYDTTNGWVTPYGLSQGAVAVQPTDPNFQQNNTNQPAPVNPVNPTLDDIQANEVLHPNSTKLFNLTNGQEEWISNDQLTNGTKLGYSTVNPATMSAVETAYGANGETFKKLNDGSYIQTDNAGNFIRMSNVSEFLGAKDVSDTQQALRNVRAGIYTPAQQEQINSIENLWKILIEKQKVDNANLTGGTTIAMNRSGLGNQIIGQQQISKTVTDGLQKVADLNTKMTAAVSEMKRAFEQDDIKALETAYNIYNTASASRQKQIDQVEKYAQDLKLKSEQKQGELNMAMSKKFYDTEIPITYYDTPAELQEKIKTSKIAMNEQKTKSGIVDDDVIGGMLADYQLTNRPPVFKGQNADATMKAFWAAINKNKSIVGQSISNKELIKSASSTVRKEEQNTSALRKASINFDNSVNRVKESLNKEAGGYDPYSRSPLVNQAVQYLQGKAGLSTPLQQSQLSAFQQYLESTIEEYAKISSGGFQSIAATTASARERAASLLDSSSSKIQLLSALNAMQSEITGSDGLMDVYNENLQFQKYGLNELLSNPNGTTYIGGGQTSSTGSGSSSSTGGGGDFATEWLD